MYVCLCRAVSSTTVVAAIETGAVTIEEIGEVCGAGMVCGRCHHNIEVLLHEHLHESGV